MPKPQKPDARPNARAASDGLDFQHLAESGQRSLEAMAHLHSRTFRDAMKLNAELVDFTRRRIGANIESSDKMTRCKSMSEAVGIVNGFYQRAVEDYARQSAMLLKIGTEIASQSTEETILESGQGGDPTSVADEVPRGE